jgi:thiosulfate/3-mercaptopyruvate sulfurtransferase
MFAIVYERISVYKTESQKDQGKAVNDRSLLTRVEELHSIIENADLRIVDCRFDLMQPEAGRAGFLQEHIPGAVYADLDKDLAAPIGPGTGRHPLPDVAELAASFGRLGISNSTQVVVYDDFSGAVAARGWWLLRWLGHKRVSVLEGGIKRWQELGLPLQGGDVNAVSQLFEPAPRQELVIETEDIVAAGESCRQLRLVDARDEARFIGESEPIDTVAGHIPGALNLPFSTTLNDDGTWKSIEELRGLWGGVLGEGDKGPWSVMCGSGVTACHLAISGQLVGLPEPRLYVGSWSEWIRDPARAVATGRTE